MKLLYHHPGKVAHSPFAEQEETQPLGRAAYNEEPYHLLGCPVRPLINFSVTPEARKVQVLIQASPKLGLCDSFATNTARAIPSSGPA